MVWHVVVGVDGKVRRNEPIPVQDGPMIHDCMITKSYVIVMDLPVTFSMAALVSGESFPYRWNPKHKARIGLLPREGKGEDTIWCDIDPCFIFHPANAFETEDGKVSHRRLRARDHVRKRRHGSGFAGHAVRTAHDRSRRKARDTQGDRPGAAGIPPAGRTAHRQALSLCLLRRPAHRPAGRLRVRDLHLQARPGGRTRARSATSARAGCPANSSSSRSTPAAQRMKAG